MSMPDALRIQARACGDLGSPFMHRLCGGLADAWPGSGAIARLCAEWPGNIGPAAASLPLRLAGGLHALVLTGRDRALAAVYPPNGSSDEALIATALAAMARHEPFLLDWMQSPPQTNEVRRSAVLIAGAHAVAARHPLPFVTSELGASAGLNLNWDRFALQAGDTRLGPETPVLTLTPEWRGAQPTVASVTVAARAGVDLNPLDPQLEDHRLRLLAYLWADQPHRVALTLAAMDAQHDGVIRADAVEWLAERLAPKPGHVHLVYHTIAWQYFPAAAQARGTRLIEAAGARASAEAPLAWLRFEADGAAPGAAITLRLWPGDLTLTLGRADFHGRWVDWATAAST